jgi:oxygen-independent coproporphyrinogen-3 oxidase
MVIGLGASAISDAKYAYAQNHKKVEDYYSHTAMNKLAIYKGYVLTPEDRAIRKCILDITCKGEINELSVYNLLDEKAQAQLMTMEQEGLILRTQNGWKITETGHTFIRNICMLFDQKIKQKENSASSFSKAI